MGQILIIVFTMLASLPTPIFSLICLVIFIGVLIMLLNLIKLILDAIPFV